MTVFSKIVEKGFPLRNGTATQVQSLHTVIRCVDQVDVARVSFVDSQQLPRQVYGPACSCFRGQLSIQEQESQQVGVRKH